MTLRLALSVALVSLISISQAAAQTEIKITGVVRDATGLAIAGATVTATNRTTRDSKSATTGTDGSFTIAMPPGSCFVTAAFPGFRSSTQTVEVTSGEMKPADFTLETMISEEITVTATKREQTLLDVPFSVAAVPEETLRKRGVDDIEDVAANVGGLTVQNLGPGQSQVAIRGVSAGQIVRDQPGVKEQVGIYLDESVVSMSLFTPDLDLFDTNRVEVLRGPQGTLFGSGSLTGTVRYITNQPEIGVTRAFAELGIAGVTDGSPAGDAKFGFNVPIGNKAAVRVASYFDRTPGFIDAVQPNLSVKENVNDGFRTGVRGSARIMASDHFTITPRIVYQRVQADGWNRNDIFNILGNPYTTSRPSVTLGKREQFTQLEEKYTDDFVLTDLNLDYKLEHGLITSITSYTYRDILVIRDATALTASITGGNYAVSEQAYTLNAPLNDATTAKSFTQELRFSGGPKKFPFVAGFFFSHGDRDYGQDLPVTGFTDLTGIKSQGLRAPKDTLFFSDLAYNLNQFALFGEGTLSLTDNFNVTGGLRFYHFSEDKEQVFDGFFVLENDVGTGVVSQPGSTDANGVAPRLIATYKLSDGAYLNGQLSRGFRLGGINDPLNVPLCTPQDLVTFGGRDTWKDEKVWNYEGGVKSRVWNGMGGFSVSGFYLDIHDLQATVTAGSCSSRVVFNVPKARSAGVEIEFDAAPNRNFDFAISMVANNSELRSTLTSTDPSGVVTVVSGIEKGRRLPTVPDFQLATAATYQWEVKPGMLGYVTGTYQHMGSRFTQVGDETDLGTLNLLSFGANTIGRPLTQSTFTYDPELPAYDLLNLRVGVRRNAWDIAFYINNITDERALLSLDRERGTRARIGFLTNEPRSFGVSTRFDF
ncbi:MAG TPA: TonB-dependent receptor [Vicinamibacterales bacterium]|jgi:iron complex outermembrane receptor protein|nr:TonB-dependent receptor [Vicinamibacterales bacterium]